MKLLLDTHTFIWLIADAPQLSGYAKTAVLDNELCLSIASLWEMAIKISLGKLSINDNLAAYFRRHLQHNTIELLPIQLEELEIASQLPHHHKDPFDRLIASQSIRFQIPLLSKDKIFDRYGVERIW